LEVFAAGGNNSIKLYNENLRKEKDIEIDVELLALKCKSSDKEAAQKYKNELSSKLSELFDIRESKKHDELAQLEKRIKDLRESLQERHDNKQEIIQRRIQELLGNPKNLNWE
jgi:cell division protein ZapA (FtsZ GTPase activity inhibitor)